MLPSSMEHMSHSTTPAPTVSTGSKYTHPVEDMWMIVPVAVSRNASRRTFEPSKAIHEKYRTMQFVLESGRVVSGVVLEETPDGYRVAANLLTPDQVTVVRKDEIDEQMPGTVSAMPTGLLNVLTRDEVVDLVSFVEAIDALPPGLMTPHGDR